MSQKVNFTTSGNAYNIKYWIFLFSNPNTTGVNVAQNSVGYTSQNTLNNAAINIGANNANRVTTTTYGSNNAATVNNVNFVGHTAATNAYHSTGNAGYTTTSGKY